MNVIGVGGHSKVVIDVLKLSGVKNFRLFDDDEMKIGSTFFNELVIGKIDKSISGNSIIAIGNNTVRKRISILLTKCKWRTFIHPSATVANDVQIGVGSVVMAGVIIQPGTKIGEHVIVNTGAIIDHDCSIGDYVHIGPGSVLAGSVSIGDETFIGLGSKVIQNKKIGINCIIGAGSVVIKDILDNTLAFGVPAKKVN